MIPFEIHMIAVPGQHEFLKKLNLCFSGLAAQSWGSWQWSFCSLAGVTAIIACCQPGEARLCRTPIISNLFQSIPILQSNLLQRLGILDHGWWWGPFRAVTFVQWLAVLGVPKNLCGFGGVYRWLFGCIILNDSLDGDRWTEFAMTRWKVWACASLWLLTLHMNACNLYDRSFKWCQVNVAL